MPTTNCNIALSGEYIKKCGYRPKQGISRKWYGNWSDIDREATQLANRGTKISLLVLKTGAKLYPAGGNSKTSKASHSLSILDFGNSHIHTDKFAVIYNGENERERTQELVDGARVFTVIERIDTGLAGELSYEVAGFESGMLITEHNYDSAANSGTVNLTVATEKGQEEATGLKLFLVAAGATATKTYIEANQYVTIPAA